MSIAQTVFYAFSALAILAASMVIFAKNPVRAVLFLILTFFATSGLWMLLEAEFLAIILVLVYVGAVMVLFLFVVMMLDIELAQTREGFIRYLPLGLGISTAVVLALIYAVGEKEFGLAVFGSPIPHDKTFSNIKALGALLYTQYWYPFEIAGVLLLVAIVSAISLTFRGKKENKAKDPAWQVAVQKRDRVRLIKMKSESETV